MKSMEGIKDTAFDVILALISLLYSILSIVSAPLFVSEYIGVGTRGWALVKALVAAQLIIIVGFGVNWVCQLLKREVPDVEKSGLYNVIMCCSGWAQVGILPVYLVCPFVGAPTYARWVDSIPEWIVSAYVWLCVPSG